MGDVNPKSLQVPGLKAYFTDPFLELYSVEVRTKNIKSAYKAINELAL
jgi:hypothetical protein